nr:hypothetical protein [Tanacetum cinerariifolium]
MVMNVRNESRLSMSQNRATFKTLVIMTIHMTCQQIEEEQAANARYWKILACCDDDDDYNFAITPNEPVDSLSMGDEHLNTILATKSDEFINSSVENLVPNPSESEGESECDMPAHEEFTTFSNVLFDAEYEFDSSNDQSCSDEDVLEKIFSNPLFNEEIISMKIDQHHYNAESDLIESLLNHNSSIIPSSSKIDSLLDEFAGELTLLKSIPPGIDETDCDPEEDIHLIERFLYDNSSPRPPKEFVSENSNAETESFSPSLIPVEDSDSFMEEIDLSVTSDDPMPPGIEKDDYDSERDILIHEELLDHYSLSLPENKSFRFDIPSFSRPPSKPPDGNTGFLNIKTMGDVFEQKPFAECPMIIHEKNIPILLLHLAGSQPMLKSSYKAEDGVIISIPLLVGGVADVVVEIKGIEFVSENSNAETESFSPSLIPVEDSDSFMEEIDLSFTLDDPMPPGIEKDDYGSERDILIREELLDHYSFSLPENKSFHFDIPSFSHPPSKPPDGNT